MDTKIPKTIKDCETYEDYFVWLQLNVPHYVSPQRLQGNQHVKVFKTPTTRRKMCEILAQLLNEQLK